MLLIEINSGELLENLLEASYAGNIGAMEMAKFFKIASPDEKSLLRELIQSNKAKSAWKLIQKVTKTRLKGEEFGN